MRGSLRFQLLSALVLLPVIVAGLLTTVAIKLFRDDKELYVYDLSAQTADLLARNLETAMESLRLRAEALQRPEPPIVAVQRLPGRTPKEGEHGYRVESLSGSGDPRLRLHAPTSEGELTIDFRPEGLLNLRGFSGLTNLMVVNDEGQILIHSQQARVPERQNLLDLVRRLKVFTGGPRVGTRAVDVEGVPSLVAHARVSSHVAVLQAIARKDAFAAAQPLITSAVVASGGVVVVAILIALLIGRVIIRPLRLMTQQTEAIARGEFGVATEGTGAGDVGLLMESMNTMSSSLKKRESELIQMQHQLLQAERLNTAGRMVSNIVKELTAPLESCFTLANETVKRLPEGSDLRPVQERLLAEADRAANILQNLARISAGDEAGARAVEVDMVVADVLVSAGPLLERRKIRVETDLSIPVGRVMVSPDQLRNALLDIFLFVAEEAEPASSVMVSIWKRAAEAIISVQYAGSPITRDEGGRLFRSGSGSSGRSSLVLAVASMVLEEHKGRLAVEALDSGNRLNVMLPLTA